MAKEGRRGPVRGLIARLRGEEDERAKTRRGKVLIPIQWEGKDELDGVLGGGAEAPIRHADLTPEQQVEAKAEFAKRRREEAERMAELGLPLDEPDDQGIKAVMSESEMREAGVRIDVPTEGASGNPRRLRYADGKGGGFPGERDFEAEAKAKAKAEAEKDAADEDENLGTPKEGSDDGRE